MNDLFGQISEQAPFKDIRNQRESVAAEKARLCQELNSLLRRTPPPSAIATIQLALQFKYAHKAALRVLQNKASSRQELRSAINSISAFTEEPA